MAALKGAWAEALADEFNKDYYRDLYAFVKKEYESTLIFPPAGDLFNALHLTDLNDVKVVILGQDPYHEPGQAHGLCFSVRDGIKIPPSLVNIYKEIHDELGVEIPDSGDLTKWARQGVLLLNTVLTVRAHQANSHKGRGWERFTDRIIEIVGAKQEPVVFMLWGSPAQAKASLITNPNHLVLKSPHPSPLSAYRGFFGCGHFSQCNIFLEDHGLTPVEW